LELIRVGKVFPRFAVIPAVIGCTQEFRQRLLAIEPRLEDPALMRVFQLCAWPIFSVNQGDDEFSFDCDEEDSEAINEVVLYYEQVGWCEGKLEHALNKNYSGTAFLNRSAEIFQSSGLFEGFELLPYSKTEGKANAVVCKVTQTLGELIDSELLVSLTLPLHELCRLDSGKPYTYSFIAEQDQAILQEAGRRVGQVGCSAQSAEVARFMNSRPSNRYSRLLNANTPYLLERIARGELPELNGRDKALLNKIRTSPRPIYGPSKKLHSPRVYGIGGSVLGLRKVHRDTLCRGLYSCDIVACQFTVLGYRWDIPEAVEYALSGGSVWDRLASDLSIPLTKITKKKLKKALYSLFFGMSATFVIKALNKCQDGLGIRFAQLPVINHLLGARELKANTLAITREYTTHFGHHLTIPQRRGKTDRNRIYSILAQDAQEIEMDLMLSLIDFDKNTKDLDIFFWIHDSIIAKLKPGREQQVIARANEAFEKHALQLGIRAKLEWEKCE
jgi:hypothetical protein